MDGKSCARFLVIAGFARIHAATDRDCWTKAKVRRAIFLAVGIVHQNLVTEA